MALDRLNLSSDIFDVLFKQTKGIGKTQFYDIKIILESFKGKTSPKQNCSKC